MKTYKWISITIEIEIMMIHSYVYRVFHKDSLYKNERAERVMQTTLPISFK